MRLFQALIVDEHLEGTTTAAICSEWWSLLLGRAESLKFTCIVDHVGGTSPTLSLTMYGSTSYLDFVETTSTLLSGVALVSGTNTFAAAYSTTGPTYPPPRHLGVEAVIAGTNATAHVRVWACGRGPQLLEAMPAPSSFAAQYAAAQRLEDEDRLPLRKMALRQGASLFYPPDFFLPSLKWER